MVTFTKTISLENLSAAMRLTALEFVRESCVLPVYAVGSKSGIGAVLTTAEEVYDFFVEECLANGYRNTAARALSSFVNGYFTWEMYSGFHLNTSLEFDTLVEQLSVLVVE